MPDLMVADILALPDALRRFLGWIILNRAVTIEPVARSLGCTDDEAAALLEELSTLGLIERLPVCGEPRYRVCLNGRRLRVPSELLENDPGIGIDRAPKIIDLRTNLHKLIGR